MKAWLQRVSRASVTIDGEVVGKIEKGYLVLLGVTHTDSEAEADRIAERIPVLRLFTDEKDLMNLSLEDVGGSVLVVSQFTLYADCHKGNRPTFNNAGNPTLANELYEYIIAECKKEIPIVQTGRFGADMQVSLVNDGPFTIMLD